LEWPKKFQPNLVTERADPLQSVHPTSANSSKTIKAISQVSSRKALSPVLDGGAKTILVGGLVLPETAAEFIKRSFLRRAPALTSQ